MKRSAMTHQEIEQNDVVEAYVMDRLSETDKQAFEEHFFACDACYAQVQEHDSFVRGVRQAAESDALPGEARQAPVRLPGWLRPVFALGLAAAIVVVAVTAWLSLVQIPELRRQAEERQRLLDEERRHSNQLEQQLALNRPPAVEPNLPLVMLQASRAAGETNTLTIPDGASRFALWIELGPEAGAGPFRLELKDEGTGQTSIDGLTRNIYGALSASLPSNQFRFGTYTARLYGPNRSLVSEYRLQVRK